MRSGVRYGFVHTSTVSSSADALSHRILRIVSSSGLDVESFKTYFDQSYLDKDFHHDVLDSANYSTATKKIQDQYNIQKGDFALLINGRLVSNLDPIHLDSLDYTALIETEAKKVGKVDEALSSLGGSKLITASSIVNDAFFVDPEQEGFFTNPNNARSGAFDHLTVTQSTFSLGNPDTAKLHFSVLLDPLGESAQRWSGMLEMLSKIDDVFIKVVLNPSSNVTELPLKRFYRFNAPHQVTFDQHGQLEEHTLSFYGMPQEAVLTMGLDAPSHWLTMPKEAIYDLDNIRLRDAITSVVSAKYELKYILIEGHARDTVTRATPRGLQLVLETLDGSTELDTIVMANLAYFQFRARPGLYRLRIRQGRSSDLFDMSSVGSLGWDSPSIEETGDYVTLHSLDGLTIYPQLKKKRNRLREILVEDTEARLEMGQQAADKGLVSKAQKVLSSLASAASFLPGKPLSKRHADINVFTVASGHLYERMTYIMILSVLKHTQSTVKFWFIENFLSPSFKSFIPLLAQEYKFDYELVTYAWPHWLRHQSEKQRSIWGMKVLFLDVLFPLDLSRVIFVDADQIVRADLQELVDLPLNGAPYGFPPMGNDSHDMDNFRFWESGYWERFLQGLPYPISALFVVDLNRFRLVAAGDKLRGQYQALSADPASLSNLDQDLVASMIHAVPIHSLEKEWLWCETWCSWDWYDAAKSIDLCSNPKTHEPKLDRARRQIPEWTQYDDEVAAVARRLEEQGKLGANVVATSKDKEVHTSEKKQEVDSHMLHAHDEL